MLSDSELNAIVISFLSGQEIDGSLTKTAERLTLDNPWEVSEFSVTVNNGMITVYADNIAVFKVVADLN